ncbi:calsenilin [Cimex lectularius]|uniref:EF-hand domain-containing protein n=1 Tax=Cimex lectularius TaxID=79782 RepID=A0A8I6SM99_CIMLE|nr:calsenilin [Cimex lectularius]
MELNRVIAAANISSLEVLSNYPGSDDSNVSPAKNYATLYAHYVFKAFDVNCNGAISFRDLLVTLSTLLRGSIYEKLRWAFKLYDINGDGCITRSELGEIVIAVHELMGRRSHQAEDDRKAREQLDIVFRKLDINQDGVITLEEFIESCLKDDMIIQSLRVFDGQ